MRKGINKKCYRGKHTATKIWIKNLRVSKSQPLYNFNKNNTQSKIKF